ncbi:N-6 DNA methylase [Thermoflexibacter ruber]|uniref:Type I restriction enzyme M protein n=1 Tax=Thermoflexibacter ruber TaxID=1003 RepID=A0A1I2I246_9BACT|nr:N-6 DNA methylase [Thermoflexibacter ruber]SFF36479.1 type I restriction enzyme M protein [Thermoflexibacter ruber]
MAKNLENTITDFISGLEIKSTPEEIEAVQVFARQLVEDYGYPKTHMQTHPQHRVKARPSDTKKEYPVDIAVFKNDKKDENELYIVVECKKKNRKDGRTQLENYLTLSNAHLGVWFNGEERIFIRKFVKQNGEIVFEEILNIPQFGQRIEDIGKFTRQDLKPTHNLKAIFKSIRNHLAANTVGATRDEVLAQQLINLIFCKLYDEKYTAPDQIVKFRAGIDEKPKEVERRILDLFKEVKTNLPEVIDDEDRISLDTNSIVYVVGELQNYSLMNSERDVIADAFETFIGHALKGGQGQFFTPRNVVKMIVEILQPTETDKIIDPACGSGGFLIDALRFVWEQVEQKYKKLGWREADIEKKKIDIATKNFRGIDKDYFLSKVAKAYMNLVGDGTTGIFCEDSLELPENWRAETRNKIQLGTFDVLLTNPPFGEKIKVKGEEKLRQFELAYEWKNRNNQLEKGKLKTEQPPQILFIERCMQLLKEGGRMAMVLPEGTFGNPTDRYVWNYLLQCATVEAIISTPSETFQPNTHFKTSILVVRKGKPEKDYPIFMGIANTCGHNKNGKEIYKINQDGTFILDENGNKIIDDELVLVLEKYKLFQNSHLNDFSHLGFVVPFSKIKNSVFIPDYYDPELQQDLDALEKTKEFELKTIQDLVNEKVIQIKRGNEIGSQFYGKGDIPFIRTSDIVNWELKIDPIKCVPQEVYEQYKKQQDVKENDILFVKDGTFLIGRSAIVSKENEKIIIQSHLLKIRVLKNDSINAYYLLYLLNLPIVQKQIKKYTFIQGTISTVGERFYELKLPILKDVKKLGQISDEVKNIMDTKQKLREQINQLLQ